jgi:hypothetical protein
MTRFACQDDMHQWSSVPTPIRALALSLCVHELASWGQISLSVQE